jgi:hypothetical protein
MSAVGQVIPTNLKEYAMRFNNVFAVSMVAASLMVAPAAFAAEPTRMGNTAGMGMDGKGHMAGRGNTAGMGKMGMDEFMKSCDMDHDGMMSKAEMLSHMEKMFDQMDAKKTGKLDKRQSEAFLKQFTAPSGG